MPTSSNLPFVIFNCNYFFFQFFGDVDHQPRSMLKADTLNSTRDYKLLVILWRWCLIFFVNKICCFWIWVVTCLHTNGEARHFGTVRCKIHVPLKSAKVFFKVGVKLLSLSPSPPGGEVLPCCKYLFPCGDMSPLVKVAEGLWRTYWLPECTQLQLTEQ